MSSVVRVQARPVVLDVEPPDAALGCLGRGIRLTAATVADVDSLDWLTPLAGLGPVPGLTRPLAVTLLVPKTAEGDLRFTATFQCSGTSGDDADEVELTAVPKVAADVASGAVTPNVAWMSGRLKASGPTGPLLAVLALADSVADPH